jgi:thymidine phosphorylase
MIAPNFYIVMQCLIIKMLCPYLTLIGGQLLVSVKKAPSLCAAYDMIDTTLQNGTAIKHFVLMLKEQGVTPELADKLCEKGIDISTLLPLSEHTEQLKAETEGSFVVLNNLKC